jgi:DNA-binding LacI/PurR family transcriptional regulator
MFDVAAHCGVSHQTVSRVINGNPNVSAKTRAKVLAAIDELGYQQNLSAKALATGRTQTLGVLSFDSTLYGPTAMLHSIQVAARDRGYRVVLNSVEEISNRAIAEGINALSTSAVDGILVIAPRSSDESEPLVFTPRVPVLFREVQNGESFAVVDIDQRAAARLATSHLISLGHKNTGHISGPASWLTAERRADGWRQALAEAGLPEGPVAEGDWTPASGYAAAKQLIQKRLSGEADFTAVFVANDAMALGALRAFSEAGLRVPGQISVIGFDDAAESGYSMPSLSTVRQDFDTVGADLLEILLHQVEQPGSAVLTASMLVAGELVVRESTSRV